MTSMLTAICNLAIKSDNVISNVTSSRTIANAMGDSLQAYVEKLFIPNASNLTEEQINNEKERVFSWSGNQNNIPDLIIKGGDAIEIKKIEGTGSLALNSSYPKQVLCSDSPMITRNCRNCEGVGNSWQKELWYVIGTVNENRIKYLFFIQGKLYAAENSIYDRIKTIIKSGVTEINNVEFSETKELGRVNRVDPLGITSLRIRGMWDIEHPFNVYNYISEIEKKADCEKLRAYVLVEKAKYLSFDVNERTTLSDLNNVQIFEKKIKNPDNPVQLIDTTLIKVEV